jgi:hypothetical protein
VLQLARNRPARRQQGKVRQTNMHAFRDPNQSVHFICDRFV